MNYDVFVINVSQVAEGIYLIDPEDRPGNTCSVYLIVDRRLSLVETGPTVQVETILKGLAQIGYPPTSIDYIIPTHIHLDHGGGVGYAAHQFPHTMVVVHERGARHLVDPSKLIAGTKQIYGEDFEQEYGPILAVPEERLKVVRDGDIIPLGDRQLRVIYSPGHAPHHICLLESTSRGLFCGEALGAYFAQENKVTPLANPGEFDLELALETINKLRGVTPQMLFFSHFGVVREVSGLIIEQADKTARLYGDIVLAAMRQGEGLEQIVHRLDEQLGPVSAAIFKPRRTMLMTATAAGYMSYFQSRNLV